ncbi:adhesin, partial [Erwinia sp. OLMDLW33]
LKEGDATVSVSVSNAAGNGATAANTALVDATAPTLTINTIAGNNVLNGAEAGADVAIGGTSTAEAGQQVTLTLNGQTYTASVAADGTWSTTLPAASAGALADGTYTVSASVSDIAGNRTGATSALLVDATAPVVTINTIAGDDVINSTEHAQAQVISGSSTGTVSGNSVSVVIDGHTYNTVVDASGNWSVGVPASAIGGISDGTYTVSVSITDSAGNTGSQTHNVTVDTGLPGLSIDAIAQDNVLNAVEKGADLTISGTGSNLSDGTQVSVTLNGVTYSAQIAAGVWSLTVPASALAALGEANYTVTASANSDVGNTITESANLLVDTSLPSVIINAVAGDNIINAAEAAAGQTLSGRVSNAAAGDTVTVTLGGHTYQAKVQADLSWSVSVPAADLQALGDGDLTVSASVTNQHGNTGSGDRQIGIDAGLPGLRINTVAGDDIVNSIEINQNQIISGTSSDIAAGSSVTVTVNGT